MNKQTVLFIVGPTATGKTALAVEVAKRYNTQIVSADSMQIYRRMDIGTAKPTLGERQGIPHHMIDILDPCRDAFSVVEYQSLARAAIDSILAVHRLPIVAGGTGLYINALTYPMSFTSVAADSSIRAKLEAQYEDDPDAVFKELKASDPVTAKRLHPNDKKRVVRALEVFIQTGKPFSTFGEGFTNMDGAKNPYRPLMFGLNMPREELYSRINRRVEMMMEAGLLEEVKALERSGCTMETAAMQGIGYRQLLQYLAGEITLEDALNCIKMESRRYAKRQITWFKRDKRIRWLDVTHYKNNGSIADDIIRIIRESGEGESEE